MARARKRAANLEAPRTEFQERTAEEAIAAFDAHCVSDGLKHSILRKYRNSLGKLREFCDARAVLDMAEITVDVLDAFRAGRRLSLIAGSKELELLRQFFKFCLVRHWVQENPGGPDQGPAEHSAE